MFRFNLSPLLKSVFVDIHKLVKFCADFQWRTIVVDDSSWNNSVLLSFPDPLNWLLSKPFSVLNTEQGPENYEMFLERMYH